MCVCVALAQVSHKTNGHHRVRADSVKRAHRTRIPFDRCIPSPKAPKDKCCGARTVAYVRRLQYHRNANEMDVFLIARVIFVQGNSSQFIYLFEFRFLFCRSFPFPFCMFSGRNRRLPHIHTHTHTERQMKAAPLFLSMCVSITRRSLQSASSHIFCGHIPFAWL